MGKYFYNNQLGYSIFLFITYILHWRTLNLIAEIKDYMTHHKIANSKEMAKELSIDEDQLILILKVLNITVVKNFESSCGFGACNPKNRLKCGGSCKSYVE